MFEVIATMRRGSSTGIAAAWARYDTIEGVYVHRPVTAEFAIDAAARFEKLRDAFGPKVDFIIHNHMGSQAWPRPMNLNEAVRVLQALEPVALLFAEEPLP